MMPGILYVLLYFSAVLLVPVLLLAATLDLPQPFGPTIAVTPGKNSKLVFSANDLKPTSIMLFRYIWVPTPFFATNNSESKHEHKQKIKDLRW